MIQPLINTALTIEIRDTLLALIQANDDFKNCLLQDHILPAWTSDSHHARRTATQIATQLTYHDLQSRQKTTKCIGVIGISLKTYQTGLKLNEKKDAFKAAMLNYRSAFGTSIPMHNLSSQQLRDNLLGHLKLQNLHFIQAYRHIRLFRTPPERIRFSWSAAHTGSVQLIKRKAIEYLKNKFTLSKGLQVDIEKLESFPDHTKIVIQRVLKPHLRANLTWPLEIEKLVLMDSMLRSQYPLQINTPLPIFTCLDENHTTFPEFNTIQPLESIDKSNRVKRKDSYSKHIHSHTNSLHYRVIDDKVH
ncbi:MAG: hypothetical protein HAW62_05345 [Endozoicomonadaceae bacterium]|nr:hypothetical protein [Endozoicomonadaceae bacterium]